MPVLTNTCPDCAKRAADVLRVEHQDRKITTHLVCRHCGTPWLETTDEDEPPSTD